MYKGMYVAATGAVQRSNEMDNVANNLANVNTTGFKRNMLSAASYQVLEGVQQAPATIYPNARTMTSTGKFAIDSTLGAFQTTGNSLDFALSADSFFVVEKNGKQFYTRNGAFVLDRDGFLSTPDGYRVLDRGNQPIVIDNTEGSISVSSDGNMYIINVQQKSNTLIAEMNVAKLSNSQHAGGSLFTGTAEDSAGYEVYQGVLERSNVNPVSELVSMIAALRQYEMSQKVIQNFSDLAQRTVADIGKPGA
ncbi:MAG TPA: flagellar hook-basal body protein [Dissulfurispiraceae bacterium]|nr:flagellar hook-basal body protein [Dissulfurispiraceae bacterium]